MQKRPLPYAKILFVCTNERTSGERVCCAHRSGGAIRAKLKEAVKARKLRGRVRVSQSGCQDRCEDGPNVMLFPDNLWYSHVAEDDVETILDEVVAALEREGQLPRDYERKAN